MLKVLDLFSGIGGFSLGLERAGMQTIAFCEIEEYPRRVLRKHWPDVPIFEDVRRLNADDLPEQPDVIVGGYPCQPFSLAGKREGAGDDRHLWPEMLRLVETCQPGWVIAENVAGHISMGLDQVLSDLENTGYTVWPFVIPAVAVDASHRRDRVWIVANVSGMGCGERTKQDGCPEPANSSAAIPHRNSIRLEGRNVCNKEGHRETKNGQARPSFGTWFRWEPEPAVGRVADGVPAELDFIGRVNDELSNNQKADAETIRAVNGRLLRTMWKHRALAATSPDAYRQRLRDCVPEMPYSDPCSGWLVGARAEENQGLRDLWEAFCAKSQQEAQNLQQELLERIREAKRPQALGSRADRLRALGNAVVPQIPEIIGRAILEAT